MTMTIAPGNGISISLVSIDGLGGFPLHVF
jgi:hypothetical protein